MSVEITQEAAGAELIINLKAWGSFADMKAELEKNLSSIDSYLMGSKISIDIGNKSITERQLREMEDMLLEHGFHLNALISGEEPRSDPGRQQIFSDNCNYVSTDTTMIYRSLRSGQIFRSEGNMVVLGDINPGAEVIAGGNILVMGALKGIAHAGANGDEGAVIAAFRLNPIQLRIANHITRPPDGENIVVNSPELAKIRAGKVVIEKLKI
ncbi:MAG TPA: septum site-determining protein MinC [Syntrophomonas sp.]|nr:septum site-determining protein MinC [Syntrophomonas sp.]